MKIIGIGVDIVDNKIIRNSLKNAKFKNRVYDIKELKQSILSKNKVNYFSKRFAAKEAFAKALGTGFRFDLKGGQRYFDIKGDLVCFGKGMGNGLPISAITGPEEFMRI